ncbi:hypothetical protein FK178_03630 [Antarcticibacterium arcticum]|uniref:Uncharacterized protein n=1 Tax=Antarcticibacterium arcticum TaxID=2585771 RepID=A0A5B8YKE9_9FLAO|nr:hypothetical protein [Antarcticibacterium arcticum]QED36856.1 hypothetical protein FK178_03630 [Antarcticibacterium arcticum]
MKTKSKSKLLTKQPSGFLLLGSVIAFFIAFSPYIFYLYEIFPDGPVWENSFFTYESKYYLNVTTAMWMYFGKITPLLLLLIWFFTCKHWWYHAILVPITMYSYQLIVAFYEDAYMEPTRFLDADQLIYLAPFFIVILSIVYLVRTQIFDRIYGIDLSELNETDVSVFSTGLSSKDETELEQFRQEDLAYANEPAEDYYRKL